MSLASEVTSAPSINAIRRPVMSTLDLVGDTPLVYLERFSESVNLRVYAKLESFNVGGSIKDRAAHRMILQALAVGRIGRQTIVVESSSGNLGVGLARICKFLGLRFVCVVDPNISPQKLSLIQAYGGEISAVRERDPDTGEFLPARLTRVRQLLDAWPNSFWPNQYGNLDNAGAHHRTMEEIVSALEGRIDYLFCATSSCGTLRGCADYLRANKLRVAVIAVDSEASNIFGPSSGCRRLPGMGAALRPELFDAESALACVRVSDVDCIRGCRRLAASDAILVGGSSGGVIAAISAIASGLPSRATCVAILPDAGDHYLDTIYSDPWITKHYGVDPAGISR
jgi:2,3-diaminopropionate biosynthesis protein SbnA